MKFFLLSILLFTSFCSYAQTDTIMKNHNTIPVTGIFKEIQVENQNRAISILFGNDQEMKLTMAGLVLEHPERWNPPVLYSLSMVLFMEGNKDDAAFWFYVAQLQARIDANICLDNTAKQGVDILNEKFGPIINEYALKDINKLEGIVTQAVKFVRKNEPTYDRRWLNLHGMWAITSEDILELSIPKDQWDQTKKQTIDDYWAGFEKYVLKKE